MGKNVTPYNITICEENIYFLNADFKFIERENIDDNELLKTKKGNVDSFNYHFSNYGKYSSKKI